MNKFYISGNTTRRSCVHSLPIGEAWTCEIHPGHLWSGTHTQGCGSFDVCPTGCPGPGMPLSASLALLRDATLTRT